jgi:polyphosphate kinase
VLTADRDVGQDLTKVFNFFTGPTLDDRFRKLLIAPVTMRERFTECIRREAERARDGERARIVVKVNGLEDPEIVEELYLASMAGVEIDLIVRDICRLRPGLDGISETVRVHSIVGRFLEHSRIFYFENGGDPEWYIGSADWMTRNLDNRVEAIAPVDSPAIKRQLRYVLDACLTDNRRRWEMNSDGTYDQVQPADGEPIRDVQQILADATDRAVSNRLDIGMDVADDVTDHGLLVEPVSVSREDDDSDADAAPAGISEDGGQIATRDAEQTPGSEAADDDTLFDTYADAWYVPDSERYNFAVRTTDGDRRYFVTREGARERLLAEYGPLPESDERE